MPKRQIPFLSSVLRGDIQNYCKFELQSPDNMTIVNKLLYIDSYYLASMVIFSNVLKRWFWNNFLAKSCFKTTFHHGSLNILNYHWKWKNNLDLQENLNISSIYVEWPWLHAKLDLLTKTVRPKPVNTSLFVHGLSYLSSIPDTIPHNLLHKFYWPSIVHSHAIQEFYWSEMQLKMSSLIQVLMRLN